METWRSGSTPEGIRRRRTGRCLSSSRRDTGRSKADGTAEAARLRGVFAQHSPVWYLRPSMKGTEISVGEMLLGAGNPLCLIAGPCVIESEAHAMKIAERVARIAADAGVPCSFKASYDKANRSSVKSFRGPGLAEGLRILAKIKSQLKLPILTDVHAEAPAGKPGRVVNVKKPQFSAPQDMSNVTEKIASTGNKRILLTERGSSFGYHNLVVDMRSIPILKKLGYPVVFDATHSVQLPGGQGHASGGQPEFIEPLARAAVAAGADSIFLETHDNPAEALSDGANALPLGQLAELLARLKELGGLVRKWERG